MEELELKNKLESFVNLKSDLDYLSYREQVRYLAYFYVKSTNAAYFTPKNIESSFVLLSMRQPSNIHDVFYKLYNDGIFVKNGGFCLSRRAFNELEEEFRQVNVESPIHIDRNEKTDLEVVHISGEAPWTDRNKVLSSLLGNLKGEILVLDPFYGLGTFHILSNVPKNQKVKFLTARLGGNENETNTSKELSRFKKEFQNIELRKYPKFYELHDRYLVSENKLIWIGHGLKDFGDSDCFMIAIPREKVTPIANRLVESFNERWNSSQNLT